MEKIKLLNSSIQTLKKPSKTGSFSGKEIDFIGSEFDTQSKDKIEKYITKLDLRFKETLNDRKIDFWEQNSLEGYKEAVNSNVETLVERIKLVTSEEFINYLIACYFFKEESEFFNLIDKAYTLKINNPPSELTDKGIDSFSLFYNVYDGCAEVSPILLEKMNFEAHGESINLFVNTLLEKLMEEFDVFKKTAFTIAFSNNEMLFWGVLGLYLEHYKNSISNKIATDEAIDSSEFYRKCTARLLEKEINTGRSDNQALMIIDFLCHYVFVRFKDFPMDLLLDTNITLKIKRAIIRAFTLKAIKPRPFETN